jgi:pyruvate dehydrogenase E2 component (dihydrolipoamide acetyltransferase)
MADFLMPILGADMTAGTLLAWRKQPGDHVGRGDIIAEVETDKGLIDVEVFVAGVIERILIERGATVPTGTVLATIREDAAAGEAPPAATPTTAVRPPIAVAPSPVVAVPPPVPPAAPAAPEPGERVRVSPLARKVAAQLGIDPATVRGTGPGGAVTHEDVERAAAERAPAPGPARPRVDVTRMRQTIGVAMARSKREIPHYYLAHTIDMHRALAWLAEENERRSVTERLLYGVLLIKAVALALREVPELNGVWRGDQAEPSEKIHVGVAISLRGGGLVAPALHDADGCDLGDLMRAFRDLVQRARGGGLRSSELSDPTITVTSLGEQGVETVFGIVYPPQLAIVGFGKVVERPWVVAGSIVARPLVTASLSADHRVTDGHRGGIFLAAVERLLLAPERL